MDAYRQMGSTNDFFINLFDDRAGTPRLREQIMQGYDAITITTSWKVELNEFKAIRKIVPPLPGF